MKRLLIADTAVTRLQARLAPFADALTFVEVDAQGRCREAGSDRVLDDADLAPDLFWLGSDFIRTGLFGRALDLAVACSPFGWMQTFNTGLDDPRYGEILARGTRLCNSHAQGPAIAQYVLSAILADWTGLYREREQQAARHWQRRGFREITGTTWLIVGFGHIGREIAKRVRAFGGTVLGVRSHPAPDDLAAEVGGTADLPRLLPRADVVVLACPLTQATLHLADAGFFAAMKPGSVLANIGRGPVVDETALLAALERGVPELAVLDVFDQEPLPADSPFWAHPRVRISPHNSANGSGTGPRGDDLFIDNLGRFLGGRELLHEVTSIDPGTGRKSPL